MSAFFKSSLNPAFLLNKIPVTKKSSLYPACSLYPGSLNPAFAVLWFGCYWVLEIGQKYCQDYTAKAGFKEPGFKEQAGFKELFLVTGILLSKKAGFKELLKKADIGFRQQKFPIVALFPQMSHQMEQNWQRKG